MDATVQLEGRTEEEALQSVVVFYKITLASYWSWGYELYWRNTGAFPCEYVYDVSGDTLTLQGFAWELLCRWTIVSNRMTSTM